MLFKALDIASILIRVIVCVSVLQEQMLKNGHAWYFKNYDSRREFLEVRKSTTQKCTRRICLYQLKVLCLCSDCAVGEKGKSCMPRFLALNNPEKPWDWRREQRSGGGIQVY